jgi:type II secretory pathway pseudopilin PulG
MASRSRGGITLLELLIVIVIFALMLGLAVYFLQNADKDLGVAASANAVASLLRAAHQQARGSSAPAWVVLNTPRNTAHLLTKETVGEWHLEDPPETGAFGKNARISGGTPVPGRVGKALQLGGSGTIHCGEVPVYAPDQGVAVELWVLRKAARRGVLATIGEQVELVAEADGRVGGRVGGLTVSSGAVRVPLDSWCHVQLVYSGRDLRLFLNRAPVDLKAGKVDWTANSPLVVGDSRSGVSGIVDEIRLSLIVPREPVSLGSQTAFEFPAGFVVPPDGEVVIGFDPEGRLDAAQPFRFAIKSPVARHEILVNLGGSVERTAKP